MPQLDPLGIRHRSEISTRKNRVPQLKPQQNLQKQTSQSLHVVEVEGKSALKEFIRLPWSIYTDDPMWIPPLMLERRMHLSPKNPYFEHAKFCSWLAYRNGKPVGRISAQVDQLYIDRYLNANGFFGMLESEDNNRTFRCLLETAEAWLHKQGMEKISGPFNFSINQELGMLVDGFDTPPSVMMGHGRPYYADRIEENGYSKEKDLLAYRIDSTVAAEKIRKIAARAINRLHIRPLQKSNFSKELKIIRDIFNDAWSQNWGFTPWTEAEFEHLGKDLKLVVNEELVSIAEVNGEPAAFLVVLPNLNEAISDLNGKLLPFGWLKLLWRVKVKYPKTARIPLMGVRRRYHDTLLGAALAFSVINGILGPAIKLGIQEMELSWILEDNEAMRKVIKTINGHVYKTYRIYRKQLK